ncbi:MAG TPA: glutathione binding-like protein [Pseudobdellovibrionaceae bacterium]|jgi:GST-like protein
MIDFYKMETPDGSKVHILLEELGMKYQLRSPEADYLKISPYGGVSAIIDLEGEYSGQIPIFESEAILNYLAEKSHHFLGANEFEKAQVMSWLMFQASVVGPTFANYEYAKENAIPLMLKHFEEESKRLLGMMDARLAEKPYLAGDFYSIADIATYPWIAETLKSRAEWYEATPYLLQWAELMGRRPAVQKAFQ